MTRLEKLALDWVISFAQVLPGMLDSSEAMKCCEAGYRAAREEAAVEINRLAAEFPESVSSRLNMIADKLRGLGEEEVT